MCRYNYFILKLLAVVCCAALAFSCRHNEAEVDKSIVILFDNDVHCAIDGYAAMAGLREDISDTAYTCMVSCGDYLQGGVAGGLSRGQHIIDIMRMAGYDVVTIGNHEFDYKTTRMKELTAQLDAEVICCNLFDGNGRCIFAPYTIRQYGRCKVAFIGVLTPQTLSSESYAFHDGEGEKSYVIESDRLFSSVQHTADKARDEGADYVVVLSHLGEPSPTDGYNSHSLIEATHGIDVVLDGHSHSVVDTQIVNSIGCPVFLAQTGSQFANIGKLYISASGQLHITLLTVSPDIRESREVRHAIDSIHRLIDKKVGYTVCRSAMPLVVTDDNGQYVIRREETNAGDLVTDAMRYAVDAEIAMINSGAIRRNLPEGSVTYGDIYSLAPYDDDVCKIHATGAKIIEVLARHIGALPYEEGEFPQVSGLKFTVDIADHNVSRVMVERADGSFAPIRPDKVYSVALLDYCKDNGWFGERSDGWGVVQLTKENYRDAVARYIKEKLKGEIGGKYASPQGRITIVKGKK